MLLDDRIEVFFDTCGKGIFLHDVLAKNNLASIWFLAPSFHEREALSKEVFRFFEGFHKYIWACSTGGSRVEVISERLRVFGGKGMHRLQVVAKTDILTSHGVKYFSDLGCFDNENENLVTIFLQNYGWGHACALFFFPIEVDGMISKKISIFLPRICLMPISDHNTNNAMVDDYSETSTFFAEIRSTGGIIGIFWKTEDGGFIIQAIAPREIHDYFSNRIDKDIWKIMNFCRAKQILSRGIWPSAPWNRLF
jgi:hypothetical protein